jgi:hypothetical protein
MDAGRGGGYTRGHGFHAVCVGAHGEHIVEGGTEDVGAWDTGGWRWFGGTRVLVLA